MKRAVVPEASLVACCRKWLAREAKGHNGWSDLNDLSKSGGGRHVCTKTWVRCAVECPIRLYCLWVLIHSDDCLPTSGGSSQCEATDPASKIRKTSLVAIFLQCIHSGQRVDVRMCVKGQWG